MEVLNETHASKMSGDSDLCVYGGVDFSYGQYGWFIVVLFFQFLNWIIKNLGPPTSLQDDEWKWRNLTISYIHAVACVFWTFASLVLQPELLSDVQHFKSHLTVCLITFTTGYFIYDFLDLALNGKMFALWEVQIHHIAVGTMFSYNLARCEWVGFNIFALLVEVNSMFLHQRKLLQMLGTPYSSRLYRVTVFLNLTTFVVFRAIPLASIIWGMVVFYDDISYYYYLCLAVSMAIMWIMNPILFMRLLRSDYLRYSSDNKRHHGKVAMNGNNNNHVKQS